MNYFYIDRNNTVVGPYNEEELRKLHINGVVNLDTNVCKEGDNGWQPYRNFQMVGTAIGATSVPVPPTVSMPVVSTTSAVLWFLCCFPIGFMQWGQTAKGWVWFLISCCTGLGFLVAIVDYWMCYSMQRTRKLRDWEFFPS